MSRLLQMARTLALTALAVGGIVVLMLWLAGFWSHRLAPGETGPSQLPPAVGATLMTVEPVEVSLTSEAVGAISAEHEIVLSSRLPFPAQVAAVTAVAGHAASPGQLLVKLNDSQLLAQLAQAEANLNQARDDNERIVRLAASSRATQREVTAAANALALAQAKHDEARTLLGYTEIRVPAGPDTQPATQPGAAQPGAATWFVIDRYAEAGDTVQPGQPLARLFDRLQLTATVPESLRPHIEVGQAVAVHVDALNKDCLGRISLIVPQAHEQSRSFQVKVTGPCQAGVIVGMFARMKVPTGQKESELRVPQSAIRRVGQLSCVFVERDGRLARQFVQTGRILRDQVVVASGLSAGDRIAIDASQVKSD